MTGRTRVFTACFADSGTPYYPDGETFPSEAELRATIEALPIAIIGEPHRVSLGSVELIDDQIYWGSWEPIGEVWAGGVK